MKKSGMKNKFSPLFLVLGIVLAIYAISLFIPIVWAILTSLKDNINDLLWNDRLQAPNTFGLPDPFKFENYSVVFNYFFVPIDSGRDVMFPELLINSLLYATGNAIAHTTVIFIVAYACARFDFKIGKVIYFTVILGMILPLVGSQPSMVAVAKQMGLYDTMWGQWLMNAHYLGMYFLVMHATLKAYPKDFDEAAQIDGANNLSVMFKIMFPLSITTFSTILLLMFIQHWNNYTSPMLLMPNIPTVAYALRYFDTTSNNDLTNTPSKLAACLLVAVPTLTLFLIFHDRLLNNVSIGGVKE
ncbi:MAG: carbohydrate ABC transporter permease [Clostridia bacterium]|nr:carbohydrate ABC transporter permease [Clostridia bacterium]